MAEWGPLGEVLARHPAGSVAVQAATAQAAELLKTIRDTFPAYTLHDERHALNVVGLMGKLVSPRIDTLTPLEAALLILSAYFHDLGMSYTPDEYAAIPSEEEFARFLRTDHEAFLAVHDHGGTPPAAVIETYARSRHAARVRAHLDRLARHDPGLLRWDGISLVPTLDRICRSHNDSAASLLGPEFSVLRGEADTRFCAMVLRLADIMDFGRSRAPWILYDYLGLAGPEGPAAVESARHWERQMTGAGFDFPYEPPDRWPASYRISYAAGPPDPDVEHAIHSSLDEVRHELRLCRDVREHLPRWRDLPLPGDIDTTHVEGLDYTYREFRFELDRPAILELFTGEGLYEEPTVFLRELLQNAIDAVRTRLQVHGELPGTPPSVEVTCWEDEEGFVWVRVDDTGTGMDERIIAEYFLRVGRSYYNSAEFRAEMLRARDGAFLPVSRFGIGVLSCFMAGDRIEVSTRRVRRGGRDFALDEPLRLSVHRNRDYFVLRHNGQGPDDMPGAGGREGFRRGGGTSIAVRIDPHRIGLEVADLVRSAEGFVLAPPVPVTVNGRVADADLRKLYSRPWLDAPVVAEVDTADLQAMDHDAFPYLGGVRVVAVPLDLAQHTEVTGVAGQLLALLGLPPDDEVASNDLLAGWPELPRSIPPAVHSMVKETSCAFLLHNRGRELRLLLLVNRALIEQRGEELGSALPVVSDRPAKARGTERERCKRLARSEPDMTAALWRLVRSRDISNIYRVSAERLGLSGLRHRIGKRGEPTLAWAQGGIRLPDALSVQRGADVELHGAVNLAGPLRPDLTVSRSTLRSVPFAVHSAVHLSLRLAAADLAVPDEARERIRQLRVIDEGPGGPVTVAMVVADRLVTGKRWNGERVIPTGTGGMSVDGICEAAGRGETLSLRLRHEPPWEPDRDDEDPEYRWDFYQHLTAGLIDRFLAVRRDPADGRLIVSAGPPLSTPAVLPALFAVPYAGSPRVARAPVIKKTTEHSWADGWLNADHALAKWIAQHAERLARDFPAPFNRVLFRAPWLQRTDEINEALDRIGRADRSLQAPPEAYVREDENGWWWSRD